MTQITTTAALFQKNAVSQFIPSALPEDYIPSWSYITIVEKTINTQTMLVTQHPMF
ncbi:hypothetical protein VPHD292_0004 [Vibrio phage D292]